MLTILFQSPGSPVTPLTNCRGRIEGSPQVQWDLVTYRHGTDALFCSSHVISSLFHSAAGLFSPLVQVIWEMSSLLFSPIKYPASITERYVSYHRVLHIDNKVAVTCSASGYYILSSYITSLNNFLISRQGHPFSSIRYLVRHNSHRDILCFYVAMQSGKKYVHMPQATIRLRNFLTASKRWFSV